MASNNNRYKSLREKLVVALVVVCGALLLNTIGHSSSQHTAIAPSSPTNVRAALPEFSLPDLNGKVWKLGDHKGKVVLVNFWATWCPPCIKETPDLVRIANKFSSQGLDVVGVNTDGGETAPVKRFVAEYGIPYPVLIAESSASLPLPVEFLPTTVLLDRHGRIAKTYEGPLSEDEFQADVTPLLLEK